MRESRPLGSVRGVLSNGHSYRDRPLPTSASRFLGGGNGTSGKLTRIFFLVIARYAEPTFQFAAAKFGDSDRAAFSDMFDPAALK